MSDFLATGGRDVHTVHFPVATPPAEVDVLIVGAGPVGLSAAIELSARGVKVAVVDRARAATLVRAGAMGHNPRTVEHFRRWGVLQGIREEWTFPPEWNRGIRLTTSLVGHELVASARRGFTESPPKRHSLADSIRRPQTALQQVFLNHLKLHGVSVAGGWRVEALNEDSDGITTEVVEVDTAQHHRVHARYVIGADGGPSTVRPLAGIAREGEHADEKHLRLVVRTGDISDRVGAAPSGVNIVFNQKASGFLAAISTREWRVFSEPYPLDYEPTEAELLETARASFGFDLELELVSATTFYWASRIAETFRKGRVLLAGDAAHVRTPGGNLGEGFGDVANLGWKLAAVISGRAPDSLLDSYDEERRRHNWRIADHALERSRRGRATLEAIRQIGVPDDRDESPDANERRSEIGDLIGNQRGEAAGVTFDERYDASSVIWYEPEQLVEEAPWRRTATRRTRGLATGCPTASSTHGVTRSMTGSATTSRWWSRQPIDRSIGQAFASEAELRSFPLRVIHLADPAVRDLYGADALLVRPDQHVAWRGSELPADGAGAVLDLVLGRSEKAKSGHSSEAALASGPAS